MVNENQVFSLNFSAARLFANAFASLPSFYVCSAFLSKAFARLFSFLEAEFNAKESLIITVEAIISERIVIAIKITLYDSHNITIMYIYLKFLFLGLITSNYQSYKID